MKGGEKISFNNKTLKEKYQDIATKTTPKAKQFKVGIDLDDVIWDLLTPWVSTYNALEGSNLRLEDIKSWDIGKYIPEDKRDILWNILKDENFYNKIEPKKNATYYLKRLNEMFNLFIVTSTNHEVSTAKFKRFTTLFPFIEPQQIIICHNKQLIDLDVLVDDNGNNLIGGRYVPIIFDMPHNRGYGCKDFLRCNNWDEVFENIYSCYENSYSLWIKENRRY